MKRVFYSIFFILLGATVNVFVAWGCMCWSSLEDEDWIDEPPDATAWVSPVPSSWPSVPQVWMREKNSWIDFYYIHGGAPIDVSDPLTYTTQTTLRVGWPARTLSLWRNSVKVEDIREIRFIQQRRPVFRSNGWQQGLVIPDWIPRRHDLWPGRGLPTQPLWPGFILNTMFYAVAAWLIFSTPWVLRSWIRRRRGCCVRCGYPGSESVVCTECGSARERGQL